MGDEPITAREIGAAINELERLRHDHRNLRMVVQVLEDEMERARLEHARLQTRLTTIVSAGVVGVSLVAWVAEMIF